jgi:hypothetical protein
MTGTLASSAKARWDTGAGGAPASPAVRISVVERRPEGTGDFRDDGDWTPPLTPWPTTISRLAATGGEVEVAGGALTGKRD